MAKKNNNIHEITIKIEGEEWQKALDESFKKKVKNVTIDGFRKGKCPRNIYDKKVGIETLFDEAGNIVLQDAYTKAIEEAKVIPVIPGEVELTSIDKDQVTFKFTITSRPLVTIKNYKGLGIKEEKATVTDEEVNKKIKEIEMQLGGEEAFNKFLNENGLPKDYVTENMKNQMLVGKYTQEKLK